MEQLNLPGAMFVWEVRYMRLLAAELNSTKKSTADNKNTRDNNTDSENKKDVDADKKKDAHADDDM